MKKLLLIFTVFLGIVSNAQDCSDLFISEYVEGPGNNNAIEIYNPTNSSIDLSDYTINRYGNGSTSGPDTWMLSGSLLPGEAIAIGNGQQDSVWVSTYWSLPVDPVFYSSCGLHGSGIYPTPFYFNGDDAMTLEKNGDIIDIFGKVGEDPGAAWTDDVTAGYTDANGGTWWSKRQTLVRKPDVKKGVTINPILFNPSLEYDSLPDATYSGMGTHTCDCIVSSIKEAENISYVVYPNPVTQGASISINAKSRIEVIEIITLLGQSVLTIYSNKIPTNKLIKGTYLMNIKFINGVQVEDKLIVK